MFKNYQVSFNTWIWSIVFHTRDIRFTEIMDYLSAFSMILFSVYHLFTRYPFFYFAFTNLISFWWSTFSISWSLRVNFMHWILTSSSLLKNKPIKKLFFSWTTWSDFGFLKFQLNSSSRISICMSSDFDIG